MRKSHTWLIIAAILLVVVSASLTAALLVSSSKPVVNTFTVGSVTITLTETTDEYIMAPGVTISKDPVVTVVGNSEKCWLFVKVEETNNLSAFGTYEIAEGWTALSGQTGVYYRLVEKSTANQAFSVLAGDCVSIKETITEEQLNDVTNNPILAFTAYAVQSDGLATVNDAWQALQDGKGE